MSLESFDRRSSTFVFRVVVSFLRKNIFAVIAVSALLLVPCFWHSRIQAGDLGSHAYNAWLARLIEHHQISGLTIASQWSNILFDVLLLRAGNLVGFAAAEKIVVSFAVLVFFWGSFSFLTEVSGNPPWKVTPFLFVLAYGYVFHMGFMNYYFSIGFAFFRVGSGLAWRGRELARRRRTFSDKPARASHRVCLVRGHRRLRFVLASLVASDAPGSAGDRHHFGRINESLFRRP